MVALIGGATDLSALWKSQLPDAGPAWLTRVEVVDRARSRWRARRRRARAHAAQPGGRAATTVAASGSRCSSSGSPTRSSPGSSRELDADEVLEVAVARAGAARAEPVADAFAARFGRVRRDRSADRRSCGRSLPTVPRAELARGARPRSSRSAAEIRAPFAVMLQLLAGTLRVDDAVARALVTTTGDRRADRARSRPTSPRRRAVTTRRRIRRPLLEPLEARPQLGSRSGAALGRRRRRRRRSRRRRPPRVAPRTDPQTPRTSRPRTRRARSPRSSSPTSRSTCSAATAASRPRRRTGRAPVAGAAGVGDRVGRRPCRRRCAGRRDAERSLRPAR